MAAVSFWTEPASIFTLYYHKYLLKENEHIPFRALREKQPGFAIGPLCATGFTNNLVSRSLLFESDCTQWLSSKNPGSVLYISFGSLAQLDEHVFVEIAHGLLLSEMNFLWVLRPGIVKSENDIKSLCTTLSDDSGGRGLIFPWCPQNDVLSHHAIGGFLTHCVWKSILESMWWGVPMICYPFFGDQLTNRKLVFDDWKIGINLCDGENISREEVSEKIKHLMSEKSCDGLRIEVQRVKNILVDAIGEKGSSQKNIQAFVKELKAECINHANNPEPV